MYYVGIYGTRYTRYRISPISEIRYPMRGMQPQARHAADNCHYPTSGLRSLQMVIFGTLGLAVPYTPRPPGENDSMKCVFLGGASAGGRGASAVCA